MQILLAAILLVQDDARFGTTRTEVPVVGRPAIKDDFGDARSEVPVVGRPGMATAEAEAFGDARTEVPVVGRPDLGLAAGGSTVLTAGWSRRPYLARALSEPVAQFHLVDLKAPGVAITPPSIAATFLQSGISLVPPSVAVAAPVAAAAASAPAVDPGAGGPVGGGGGGRGP